MRRVNITGGNLTLMDYCTAGPQYASGGFIADSADRLRHQRLAAAVPRARQQHRRLVERRLEPGLLGRRGRAGAVVPDTPSDPPPYTTLATSPVTREKPFLYVDAAGTLQRLRPGAAPRLAGHDLGERPDRRLVDPDRRVLRRQAGATSRQTINKALAQRQEPDLHARRLPRRPHDQGQAARHRRARPRLPDADPQRRRRRRCRSRTSRA